jgi:hypothetical protein
MCLKRQHLTRRERVGTGLDRNERFLDAKKRVKKMKEDLIVRAPIAGEWS